MNPKSKFHLAFNTGFQNRFDRANGRTGRWPSVVVRVRPLAVIL